MGHYSIIDQRRRCVAHLIGRNRATTYGHREKTRAQVSGS
jgi:hypothetical protein